MDYLLDTTIFSAWMENHPGVVQHIRDLADEDTVQGAVITHGEIYYSQ